jgi:hypothetical protein
MDERKDMEQGLESPETEAPEILTDSAAKSDVAVEEAATPTVSIKERRGRLIVAGLAAATIATLVAMLVVGIFQFTSYWLTECRRDRTINPTTLSLWNNVISSKNMRPPTGVPKELLQITKLKPLAAVDQESSEGRK